MNQRQLAACITQEFSGPGDKGMLRVYTVTHTSKAQGHLMIVAILGNEKGADPAPCPTYTITPMCHTPPSD